jgi:hypothetical protein
MALHWIVCLIAILPLWLLQNVIHELSHGLTLWIGWRWKFSIYPLPSTKLGRFTFAHVTYSPTASSREPAPGDWALVSIMPKIVNCVFMMLGQVGAALFESCPAVALPLALFAVFNYIDFAVGMLGIFKDKKENDLWKFQAGTEIPVRTVRIASAALVGFLGAFTVACGWLLLKGVI